MPLISEYAGLCNAIYDTSLSTGSNVNGWILGAHENGDANGMCAGVFTKNQVTVVAFRGTRMDSGNDILTDVQLGSGMNTTYFSLAETFAGLYAPGPNVIMTGHSLGGAIAQIVGNRTRRAFVTFNAPGVALVASRNVHTVNPVLGAARLAIGIATAAQTPMQTYRDARAAFHTSRGTNYRLSGDLVSRWGLHYGEIVEVPGTGDPLTQHKMDTVVSCLTNSGQGGAAFPG